MTDNGTTIAQGIIADYPDWTQQYTTQNTHQARHQHNTHTNRVLREQHNEPSCHRCNGLVPSEAAFNRILPWLRENYRIQAYSQSTSDRFNTLLQTLAEYHEDPTDTAVFAGAIREALEVISAIHFRQVPTDSKALVANALINQAHTLFYADQTPESQSGRDTPDINPDILTIHDQTEQPLRRRINPNLIDISILNIITAPRNRRQPLRFGDYQYQHRDNEYADNPTDEESDTTVESSENEENIVDLNQDDNNIFLDEEEDAPIYTPIIFRQPPPIIEFEDWRDPNNPRTPSPPPLYPGQDQENDAGPVNPPAY